MATPSFYITTMIILMMSIVITIAHATQYRLSIPDRIQWENNGGYCGETSFIQAGLYYGQWASQYDVRNFAGGELLLGVNELKAATALKLNVVRYTAPAGLTGFARTSDFLAWTRTQIRLGRPVIFGLYLNEMLFFGTGGNSGDSEYDHIVTAVGVDTNFSDTVYHAADVLHFQDHGAWTPVQPDYSSTFLAFPKTRSQSNSASAPIYSLPSTMPLYAVAVLGIAETTPGSTLLPVRITTSSSAESVEPREGSSRRPAAQSMVLTITVSGLTVGQSFNLYRYNSYSSVPKASFNSNRASAAAVWSQVATGPTFTITQTIQTNMQVAFRAVLASAP